MKSNNYQCICVGDFVYIWAVLCECMYDILPEQWVLIVLDIMLKALYLKSCSGIIAFEIANSCWLFLSDNFTTFSGMRICPIFWLGATIYLKGCIVSYLWVVACRFPNLAILSKKWLVVLPVQRFNYRAILLCTLDRVIRDHHNQL